MLHPTRSNRDREHGQIIVLFALVLVVILAFAAIVIDLGLLRNNRQTLANAMDAGALAGGTLLPVDGSGTAGPGAVTKINNLINQTVQATYPGITTPADYHITYRCLIGVTTASPPQPYISRDIPIVCDPHHALGHTPVAADFIGAGNTRSSICRPDLSDKCNAVSLSGAITTNFSFGRAVGVDSGSTGVVQAASCNGPCGQPPFFPIDVALIIDRSSSMDGDEDNLADAARAVLSAYDPDVQHVALGVLGPSSASRTCSGTPTGVHGIALDLTSTSPPDHENDTTASTNNTATSLQISRPSGTSNGEFLIAQILFNNGSSVATIAPPSGWTLVRRTNNGTNVGQALYSKFAGSSEPNSYTWTFSSPTEVAGGILLYSGVDRTNPFDPNAGSGSIGSGNTGNGNNLTANGITTTTADTRIIAFYGHENDTSLSEPNSMNEQYERQVNNSGQDLTISADDDTDGSAGATGNKVSNAGSNNQWVAQLVALRAIPPVDTYGTSLTADMSKWIPVGLSGNDAAVDEPYLNANGTLNNNARIVKAINCFDLSNTGTNLATPLDMARAYLLANGRPDVKKGIILETDGAPNYNGETGDAVNYTCGQAITNATAAKATGTDIEIFTIGFDVGSERCNNGSPEATAWRGRTAVDLLANIATGPIIGTSRCNAAENTDGDHFYCEPAGSDLTAVFQSAAAELAGLHSHLVQLYPAPIVSAIGPSGGSHNGGTTVTITGQFFTGATSVKFGGLSASFTVLSDTAISATAPGGDAGTTVDIRVSNPGGSSPITGADRYTYS